MEYHMLYVESRKSFKVRREKKTYLFTECQKKPLGKLSSLPSKKKHSAKLGTRQRTVTWTAVSPCVIR